jgi:hypothetical protein
MPSTGHGCLVPVFAGPNTSLGWANYSESPLRLIAREEGVFVVVGLASMIYREIGGAVLTADREGVYAAFVMSLT